MAAADDARAAMVATMRRLADTSGSLDVRTQLGSPSKVLLRNQLVDAGRGYDRAGWLGFLLTAVAEEIVNRTAAASSATSGSAASAAAAWGVVTTGLTGEPPVASGAVGLSDLFVDAAVATLTVTFLPVFAAAPAPVAVLIGYQPLYSLEVVTVAVDRVVVAFVDALGQRLPITSRTIGLQVAGVR